MKLGKVTTENPELADRFNRVLGDTVEALEDAGLKYLFIGGIASGGLGRPRSTHDIDVFVRPEDAELALRALAKKGFRTEKTDPFWLYKGFKENILVDIIFKSKGEIYMDTELYQRSTTAEFHGKQLRLVAPEDLVIIKAAAHSELTPGHWHDALALLTHATIDWDYLLRRARRAPRRLLSLLIYAQASDIFVPMSVIHQLYRSCFGDLPAQAPEQQRSQAPQASKPAALSHGHAPGIVPPTAPISMTSPAARAPVLRMVQQQQEKNIVAALREALAEDLSTTELDIQIEESAGRFLLRGEVGSPERRDAILKVTQERFPDFEVENQIRILNFTEPMEAEEIK